MRRDVAPKKIASKSSAQEEIFDLEKRRSVMVEGIGVAVIAGRRDNDGLHKRRGIWHFKLKIGGKWKEISTHKKNYQDARKERQKAVQAQQEGRLPTEKAKCFFDKAAVEWLNMREGEQL